VLPYVAFVAIVVGFGNYFWFHEPSLFITHPLALVGIGYLLVRQSFPPPLEGAGAAVLNRQRVQQIEQSGPLIASVRCGGSLGQVRLGWPLLKASVHPGGLLIKPVFMSPRAILAAEVSRAYIQRSFLSGRPLVIDHVAMGLRSPIKLYLSSASVFARTVLARLEDVTPVANLPLTRRELNDIPPLVNDGLMLLGLAVAALFAGFGIQWAMENPEYWFFGASWTAVVAAITALNVRSWWKSRPRGR
jgi:hypothetical protein